MKGPRLADPYRDLRVIDSRAPRFNQAVVGILSAAAVLTGWWWLLALLAVQLVLSLTLGRRWCIPCLVYFELVQRRFGEGPLEDSRPPRFANMVGVAFLGAATLAYTLGAPELGRRSAGSSPRWGCSPRRPDSAPAARATSSATSSPDGSSSPVPCRPGRAVPVSVRAFSFSA